VPLGIWASRRPVIAEYLLGIAGILQTVPTLALLALMVPLLGGAIGFRPALIALTLYSFLPILANTVTGIRGVDPTLIEAARGLGMSERQMLLRVQLPLAGPVILAGIRTATVLVVGTATLATPVGGKSLGNYIFSGMEMHNMTLTVIGCILAALLAIVMDQLVHLLELALTRRSKRLACWAGAGLLLIVLGGLYGPIAGLFASPSAVIASAPFTEQHILSEAMKDNLEAAGLRVDQRQSMGETIQLLALKHNQIDCCVNYTGNIWTLLMKKEKTANPQTTYDETAKFLRDEYGVECLGKLGFQNAYALAMRKDHAAKLGVQSIEQLARHAKSFRIAGDLQFFQRPEWKDGVAKAYGLAFKEMVGMEPALIYGALKQDEVQVICAYSTDARIVKYDFVILDDPKQAFPPYDAILLLSRKGSQNAALRAALLPLAQEKVTPDVMRHANLRVDVEGQMPQRAAKELLASIPR
jgi:osmoprotectant transport system permease protein